MQRDGFMVHLFAGEDSGFTLARAWQQQGGQASSLLEIDIKRGSQHDLFKQCWTVCGFDQSCIGEQAPRHSRWPKLQKP